MLLPVDRTREFSPPSSPGRCPKARAANASTAGAQNASGSHPLKGPARPPTLRSRQGRASSDRIHCGRSNASVASPEGAPAPPSDVSLDEATDLLLAEIRARLGYLHQVGLGYLTFDRQSRTLSGGEVQRINLTTALGTSLVNTLFVLDEPSIGLHPRDMGRVIEVMKRLRDAGNSLVVVEHDPQIMLEADHCSTWGRVRASAAATWCSSVRPPSWPALRHR